MPNDAISAPGGDRGVDRGEEGEGGMAANLEMDMWWQRSLTVRAESNLRHSGCISRTPDVGKPNPLELHITAFPRFDGVMNCRETRLVPVSVRR